MLPPSLQAVLDRFAACANARERLALLLAMGRQLPPLDDAHKRQETLVPGCQSVVYLVARLEDGKLVYEGTSDAILVKGMVALLRAGLNGLTPAQVLQLDPAAFRGSGLGQSLVPSRANGLFHIFARMKDEAARLQEDGTCGTTGSEA